MKIKTTRFGSLDIDADDILQFPAGLPGLADCRRWLLLSDAHNEALGWLQSADRPDVALAVVSPRPFVPGFQLRVSRGELLPLSLDSVKDAQVLVILGKNERGITLNLRAPLVINAERRLGRQVINNDDLPVQYELGSERPLLKKSA